VSPQCLKCTDRSGFAVSIANIGFYNWTVTLLRDLSTSFAQPATGVWRFRRVLDTPMSWLYFCLASSAFSRANARIAEASLPAAITVTAAV
jgi:hypothetical protein